MRWNPGRGGAAAVGVVVMVVIAVTTWWVMTSRPQSVPVTASTPRRSGMSPLSAAPLPGSSAEPARTPSASPALLVVDVNGKVVHPGVYRLPPGSRVYDAVEAAGGVRPGVDTVSLNLAAPLQDGQQIVVGRPAAAQSAPAIGGATGAAPAGSTAPTVPLDLNTATPEQLDTLPGVGPVLAQHILDWRTQHGQFTSVTQLNDVSGIGEVKFADLRELVTV